MSWSDKYKRSIDCDNPSGFSQKAHCAARKKRERGETTKSKSPFNEMHEVKGHKTVEQIAKKHRMEVSFIKKQLEMGIPIEHEHTKDKDLATDIALQHLDEIPDYYTRLKKMEAQAKRHHKKFKDVKESLSEGRRDSKGAGDPGYSLRDWFKGGGWIQVAGKYKGKPCAKQPGQKTKPFCRDADDAAAMSTAEKKRRTAKKRKEDPNPNRTGKAKMVSASYQPEGQQLDENPLVGLGVKAGLAAGTALAGKMVYDRAKAVADKVRERNEKIKQQIDQLKQSYEPDGQPIVEEGCPVCGYDPCQCLEGSIQEKKDACYHKVKSRYKVWPSAYASGALVKCRKVGADSWGTKSEETQVIRYCPKCKKDETRSECKYGERYWDTYSLPIRLGKKYTPNTPHPGNFPESYDHEYSMARSELSTIINAAKRLKKKMAKGEGNIEAWVQSKITKAADYIDSAADYVGSGEMAKEGVSIEDANGNTFAEVIDIVGPNHMQPIVDEGCWKGYKQIGMKKKGDRVVPNCVKEQYSNWREELAEDWQKVNRQDKTDGLSQKAVDAYRRENPGSKLQTAVTEKKPTGKRAKRRANFCRRMKGMKSKLTSAKTARDPDSRINKALRRWNCN